MHKGYLDEFLLIYEALKAVFGFERVSMCVHEKDREWFSDYAERAGDLYAMLYVPNRYSLGQEKILIHHAIDIEVPWKVDTPDGNRRPGMPPDAGIIVNNSETLFNVYNALFLGKPTTTKFITDLRRGDGDEGLRGADRGLGDRDFAHRGRRRRELGAPLRGAGRAVPQRDGYRGARDGRRRLRQEHHERTLAHPERRNSI
jgi:hypothetical protein